jgi:putative SOS response-associated peptidase YedK
MMHARVEPLTQRPAFRGPLSHHRAFIPDCSAYAWKAAGREKTPLYTHPQREPLVAFAGLYDMWMNPTGEERYTLTIITADADPYMARLRHRMPVVLARDLENDCLDPVVTDTREVPGMPERRAGVPLDAYPVPRRVNKPSIDGQGLIRPLA